MLRQTDIGSYKFFVSELRVPVLFAWQTEKAENSALNGKRECLQTSAYGTRCETGVCSSHIHLVGDESSDDDSSLIHQV